MAATNHLFSPRDAREAAEILGACSRLREAGRAVTAGVVESPFRPAADVVFPVPAASGSPVSSLHASGEAIVYLDHASMAAIHEVSTSDFLAVAGGGATLAGVLEAARGAGLSFPHEPDFLSRNATLAEIVMDGSVFRTEGRFGGLREYILGLEIATPAGEIVRTGSRSVKDVTGYDIAGLLMGSGGRCGMIARATLRLLPARGTRLRFACAGDAASVERFASSVHAALDAAFLDFYEDEAARLLARRFGDAPGAEFRESFALLVGELQASEPGRGRELLERAREIAPAGMTFRELDGRAVDAHERFPVLALEASGANRLFHLAHDSRPMAAKHFRAYNAMSLYPGRRHSYFAPEELPADFVTIVMESGERPTLELIERRGEGISRRRVGGREFNRLLERETGGGAERPRDAETELTERVYRAFDPFAIMMP